MIKKAIEKIIQETRMNQLSWERGEEEDYKKILTTKAEVENFQGKSEETLIKLERSTDRTYFFYVGKEMMNSAYNPIKEFGKYMFMDD